MLLKTCALIALIAFAQIVRAQDGDDMDFNSEHKQDDDGLEERGNGYNSRGRGNGWGNNGNRRGGLRLNGGLGGASLGLGLGGLNNGLRRNRGNIEGIEVEVANQVETNKVVPGIVEVAPTVQTSSNSVQVVGSLKKRRLQQNSQSQVVQNNVIKQTDIHVHTNTLVKKPKVLNTIVRRHKTRYIINTQPVKTNINIERQQEIIQPEVKNVVVYQNSESLQRNRLRTIVRNQQKSERLPTIREPTRNDGTDVIGNPINAGSANLLTLGNLVGGGSRGFNNGGLLNGSGRNRGSSLGLGLGLNRGNRNGYRNSYGNLHNRANTEVQEEEEKVAPEETKAEEEHVEETA